MTFSRTEGTAIGLRSSFGLACMRASPSTPHHNQRTKLPSIRRAPTPNTFSPEAFPCGKIRVHRRHRLDSHASRAVTTGAGGRRARGRPRPGGPSRNVLAESHRKAVRVRQRCSRAAGARLANKPSAKKARARRPEASRRRRPPRPRTGHRQADGGWCQHARYTQLGRGHTSCARAAARTGLTKAMSV